MQDLLLLAVVAAVFVFGWVLMNRLDRFLENNRQVQGLELSSGEDILRIGLSNPLFSDHLTDSLEQYCRLCPDSSVQIFYGAEDELVNGLLCRKLDIIFLPENSEGLAGGCYGIKKVLLDYTPVTMKYGGLSIEPIADDAVAVVQKVIWLTEATTSSANCFVGCIKDKTTRKSRRIWHLML